MITTYIIKDLNGKTIVEGDINTVIARTGLSKSDIYGIVKGGQLGITAESVKLTKFSPKKIKSADENDSVSYVRKHLALYGNTVLSQNVTEAEVKRIKKELAKEGIGLQYQYKRYDEGYGGWLLTESRLN